LLQYNSAQGNTLPQLHFPTLKSHCFRMIQSGRHTNFREIRKKEMASLML